MTISLSRLGHDLPLLLLNACATLILLKAYQDRAGFKTLLKRLDLFFAARGGHSRQYSTGWLFLASFAALYIELMLIRWIGTEARAFAYLQNLALIAVLYAPPLYLVLLKCQVMYLLAPVLAAFALATISLARKGVESPPNSDITLHKS